MVMDQPVSSFQMLLLVGAALALFVKAPSVHAQEYKRASGSGDNPEYPSTNGPEETLRDDEDFSGKVPVTFFATTTLSCSLWKDEDRLSSSRTIINKMILYVSGVCDCNFDNSYLSPLTSTCDSHAGTLLVGTNLSLPFNHQRSQLVGYLENWIKTEPSFTKTLHLGGRTTVNVVDLETINSAYFPTPNGSGDDGTEKPRDKETTPTVKEEEKKEGNTSENESGSGSSGEDILNSSAPIIAVDIGALFLSCAAVLVTSLMNYS